MQREFTEYKSVESYSNRARIRRCDSRSKQTSKLVPSLSDSKLYLQELPRVNVRETGGVNFDL